MYFVMICFNKHDFDRAESANEEEEKCIIILIDIINQNGDLMRKDASIKAEEEEKHKIRKARSYFVYFLL